MHCEFPNAPRFVLARDIIFEARRQALESFADVADLKTVADARPCRLRLPDRLIRTHIISWDCLTGFCLIREAGGWTVDFPIPGNLLSGNPVIAVAPVERADRQRLVTRSLASGELS